MSQLRKLLATCLLTGVCLLSISFGFFGTVYAEHVHHGDYTTSGIFDGDLVIIGGNLDVANTFTINGDLKIIAGKVLVNSENSSTTTVDLYVRGDLIVTNTKTAADPGTLADKSASIEVTTGKLDVTGEIFTYSLTSSAGIEGRYGIKSGKIFTHGETESNVDSGIGSIDVVGDLITQSETSSSHIRAGSNQDSPSDSYDILASYISTGTNNSSGEVYADGSILVCGGIISRSLTGSAFVRAATKSNGGIRAEYILTDGFWESSVESGVSAGSTGFIDVSGDIVTTSSSLSAHVSVFGGSLKSDSIATRVIGSPAIAGAFVSASEEIDVKGDIVTTTSALSGADAYVLSSNKNIKAKSIVTNGRNDSYVRAQTGIDVREEIETKSFGASDADVRTQVGDIIARSLQLDSQTGLAYAHSITGSIDIKGTINTRSGTSSAKVEAVGNIKAENIYTNAQTSGDGFVYSSLSDIEVKDVIKTKSTSGTAYVYTPAGDISARAIRTDAGGNGRIEAGATGVPGSITVVEDISTKSSTDDANIKANEGDLVAQKIKTDAPTASDDSISAGSSTGNFQLVLNQPNTALTITNAEFDLDKDYDWDTMLSLGGTCTINGKGHKLIFDTDGGINVLSGGTLFLNNIEIDKVFDESIKCADNTSAIKIQDVSLTLTSTFFFKNGAFQIMGDVNIFGPGTWFSYESVKTSTIKKNATLSFGPQVTLNYETATNDLLEMIDATSRLSLDDAFVRATEDIRFTNGTLVFDNKVTFSVLTGKTIFLGNSVLANNINFEEQVASLLLKIGDGSIVNSNV